jgi:hypothetical protein
MFSGKFVKLQGLGHTSLSECVRDATLFRLLWTLCTDKFQSFCFSHVQR